VHTLLSQFCTAFDHALQPILSPLDNAIAALEKSAADVPGTELADELTDVRRELAALVDKVRGQQAYVLIFGPLKSGKSTLMNALAAAYVSEVSCLPAYPCLVFVSHASERAFSISRYDGRVETFSDASALAAKVEEAHRALASRIRETEAAGDAFDPPTHFPEALRRIDVRLPAPNLAESGAVLVDTPGLYSRMKFGYSQMTRDFRNAAACAIFVVKSDNLFLEQVFDEFNQLLELFSRIFLVVNVDTQKRDLQADGRLAPSIEQREPSRIVDAFRDLAMSAPLVSAANEGRLRIHAVDLMQAASERLLQREGRGATPTASGFAAFESDLTDYLRGSAYMAAFLGDSLRRAQTLLLEIADLAVSEPTHALTQAVAQLEARKRELQRRLDATDRLSRVRWEGTMAGLRQRLRTEVETRAREVGVKSARIMDGALDAWFLSSASLRTLKEQEWAPQLAHFRDELDAMANQVIRLSLLERGGGLDVPTDVLDDLRAVNVEVAAVRRAAFEGLPPAPRGAHKVPLDAGDIPVRKTVLDWAVFKTADGVRRSVFGQGPEADARIPAKVKASRLGEPARRLMRARLSDFNAANQVETTAAVFARFDTKLAEETVARFQAAFAERRHALQQEAAEADREWSRHIQVLSPIRKLGEAEAAAGAAVRALVEEHARTDPELLARAAPLPRGEPGTPSRTGGSGSEVRTPVRRRPRR
jgi:hypothetical protein